MHHHPNYKREAKDPAPRFNPQECAKRLSQGKYLLPVEKKAALKYAEEQRKKRR